jgi:hypothetical protein
VRNLSAGILLLLKEELLRQSPPDSDGVLVRAKFEFKARDDGSIAVVGKGRNTVDVAQIKERLTSLGTGLSAAEEKRLWADLAKFGTIRNDIEHYRTKAPKAEIRAAIVVATALVRLIVADVLKEDPAAMLGEDCWTVMLKEETVYAEQKAACEASLAKVAWETDALSAATPYLRCGWCESELIGQKDKANVSQDGVTFICAACSTEDEAIGGDWLMATVLQSKGVEVFYDPSDPDGAPIDDCPSCFRAGVVVVEAECVLCGWQHSGERCAVCHGEVSNEDDEEHPGLCGYHAHVFAKDD